MLSNYFAPAQNLGFAKIFFLISNVFVFIYLFNANN